MKTIFAILICIALLSAVDHSEAHAGDHSRSHQVTVLKERIQHLRADRDFWEDKARRLMQADAR